jgi:menaquinone-dependent protoporphyrinogen IX oxidase
MSTVVIFKSKTGFAEKYGRWIAENLGCEIMSVDSGIENIVNKYDVIIYGGGLYAGQINGLKKIKTLIQNKKNKKFIVYGTGAAPAEDAEALKQVIKSNFTEEEQKSIPFFYFQGGINYEKMNIPSRLIMKTFSSTIEKQMNKSKVNTDNPVSIRESHDITDKKFIEPLITYVKKL